MPSRASLRTWLSRALLLAAVGSGAALLLLAALSSSQPTRSTRAFINFESACALALIGLPLLSTARRSPAESSDLRDRAVFLSLFVLVTTCFWPSLSISFLSDDFISVTYANHLNRDQLLAGFTHSSAGAFFRPLEYVSLSAMAPLARFDPLRWHAGNLVLHLLNSVLVYKLAARLYPGLWMPAVTALLFAVHGSRPEAVAWVNGRPELLTALFFLSALLLYLRHCETNRASLLWISLLCLLAAVLIKESAFVFPLVLLLIAIFRNDARYRRPLTHLPFWLLTLTVFAYRSSVLGDIGGYRDAGGEPQLLRIGLIGPIKALLLRAWAVLYFPINWSAPAGPWLVLLLGVYVISLIWLSRSPASRPVLYFSLAFTVAVSLPAAAWLVIGADLQKSRLLYLPSLGYCMFVGASIEAIRGRWPRWSIAACLLAFHIAALEHNLNIWKQVSDIGARACAVASAEVPPSGKLVVAGIPATVKGVYFFANGFPECVAMRSGVPINSIELAPDPKPGGTPDSKPGETPMLVWNPTLERIERAR